MEAVAANGLLQNLGVSKLIHFISVRLVVGP